MEHDTTLSPRGPSRGLPVWRGVRLRRTMAAADPDSAPRQVALPAAWDQRAAEALAALAPGEGAASAAALAEAWVRPIAERARRAGMLDDRSQDTLGTALHALLLTRRGTAGATVWQGLSTPCPGFALNLPAFHDPEHGSDAGGAVRQPAGGFDARPVRAAGAARHRL